MFCLPDKFIQVHFTLIHSFSITPSLQSAFMPSTCHVPFKNTKPLLILRQINKNLLTAEIQRSMPCTSCLALTPRLYLGLITFGFWLRSLTMVTTLPSSFYDYVYRSRLGNGFCSLLPCVWPLLCLLDLAIGFPLKDHKQHQAAPLLQLTLHEWCHQHQCNNSMWPAANREGWWQPQSSTKPPRPRPGH